MAAGDGRDFFTDYLRDGFYFRIVVAILSIFTSGGPRLGYRYSITLAKRVPHRLIKSVMADHRHQFQIENFLLMLMDVDHISLALMTRQRKVGPAGLVNGGTAKAEAFPTWTSCISPGGVLQFDHRWPEKHKR